MPNNALNVNSVVGRHANLEITTRGSDWLYTVCAIMTVSCLAVAAHSFTKPTRERLFHQLTGLILFVAAIAYFSMASNLGQTPVQAEFVRRSDQVRAAGTREIFYARYIDWFITTPLLITDLLLTAAVPWPTILATIIADEIMIVTGLIGALTQTSYKWGYWVFGMIAFLYVAWTLLVTGRESASIFGGPVKRTYYTCGILTIGIWCLYPIAWGLAEGGNIIHPDSEAIFYGILDLIAKPVFGFMLLWGHSKIDFTTLGLGVSELGHPNVSTDRPHGKATRHNGEHNGVRNGESATATGSSIGAA